MAAVWNGFDQQQLDAAYNNQAAVPGFARLVAKWRDRSGELTRARRPRLDVPYGSGIRQCFDYFAASQADAPLFVFIHGGYWQGGEKRSVGFLAEGPLAHGCAVAVIEYTVAPDNTLAGMVDEVRMALDHLRRHARELGHDENRIVLAGHSAGAQLLCRVLDEPGVVGGIAISGLYDLEPIRLSYLNVKLGLTRQDVERFSPMQHLPSAPQSLVVTVGAAELPELVRQSRDFAQASGARWLPLEGHDHFSILDELASADGALARLVPGFIGARTG